MFMADGYTKLHSIIVNSSVWGLSSDTRVVWVTLMAQADRYGEVQSSVCGLARAAVVSEEAVEEAIKCFMSPDHRSRTKTNEGRRVEEIEGGWRLINYPMYRKRMSKEDQLAKAAVRQQRHRDKKREVTGEVTGGDEMSQELRQAEAEAETKAVPAVAGGPGEVSPSAAPAKPTKPKKARKVKHQIKHDWAPNLNHCAQAKKLGIDVGSEAVKFRDYCLSAAKTYADWDAAFRNWLRNSLKFSNGSNGSPRKPRDEPLPGQVGWKRPGRNNGVSELHQQYIDRKAVEDEKRAKKANPGPANGITEDDIPY